MRLAHLILIVAVLAIGLSLVRDPIGRTFVIVFLTGVGELVLGLTAIMGLFQTVGARQGAHALRPLRSPRRHGRRPRDWFDGDVRLALRRRVAGVYVRLAAQHAQPKRRTAMLRPAPSTRPTA